MISATSLQPYSLFAGLSEIELTQLAPYLSKRTFGKGAYLYHPGNPSLYLYLVESGQVRIFFSDSRGQEYFLNIVGPHSSLGQPLLPDDKVRMTGAAAQKETVVLILSREDMFAFMKRSVQFMQNIYMDLAANARRLTIYAQAHTILRVDERLASLLLFQALNRKSSDRDEIVLPLTQSEVASWVGSSRGQINRALSKMQKADLIRLEGQQILVLDVQGLAKMAERLNVYQV
jgi:CRP-like cAMP-binding protein